MMDDEELDRLTQALLEEEDDEFDLLPFALSEKKETAPKKAIKREVAIKREAATALKRSKLEQTVRGAVKTELRKTSALQPGPNKGSKGKMVPGLARRPGGPGAPTTRAPPVRILQPNGPKGPNRSSVMPMDPTVEQRMTSAERAVVMRERLETVQEQRRKEDRKRAREVAEREQELLIKKQSIAPPPFNPAVAFRPRVTSKFGELSSRAPRAAGGPDRLQEQDMDRQNEALWELNKLKVSILGMFPLPHLDERGIADMDRHNILEFVREGMATANQRQAIDYALRRIRNAQVRGDLTQYYEWLLDLARAHRHWTEIQLDLLHELKRQRLKCEALERISGNFARYLRDLKRLSETPIHNVSAILGEYLQLPLGISPRQLEEPMDKFEALWSHLIGRRSLIFEELRARDHNCTSAELVSVLENLEKAATTLIALLTDETRKADWSNRLVRIQDEIPRLQELGKPEEIDYNDLLFEWLQ